MNRNRFRLFLVLLIVLPSILWLLYIGAYGVNVAIYDQWTFVPLIDKWETGNLTISDLATLYNDHKPFFPRLIMLFLAELTHYNNLAEMYFGWLLVCLSCFVLFLIYKKHFGLTESSLLKFIPISWLIFSFGPFEHITYGWGFPTFLSLLCFLTMIHFLQESKTLDIHLLFSAICAFVASFSFANGLLLWVIGLFQILLSKSAKRVKMGSVWSLAWIFTYTLYFYDYTKPAHHPSLFYFLKYPLNSSIFLLINIGAPLSSGVISAVPTGLILIVLSLYVLNFSLKRELAPYNAKWFSLILFSILSSIILVLGRAGGGFNYALASRFTTFTVLGPAGIYLLMINSQKMIESDKKKYILYGCMLCLICLGLAQSYTKAIIEGEAARDFRKKVAYYLSTYKFQPIETEYFSTIYPSPGEVRNGVKILEKKGMNIFAQKPLDLNKLTPKQGETLFFHRYTSRRNIPPTKPTCGHQKTKRGSHYY